jgi:beta-barrel assembly-enhancing protease
MEAHRHRPSSVRVFVSQAAALCIAAALAFSAPPAWGDRTRVKPGINIFTPDQDIEIGLKVSAAAQKKLPMLNDADINAYVTELGSRLAGFAPGKKFPYQFHIVDSKEVNSFALPGGQIFIYRGAIEEASNEAQLAGILAHEISHVALRHGTNQATRAQMSTGILGAVGGVVGGGSFNTFAAEMSGELGGNSILLKHSKTAEVQADVVGTQILYDAGYDPRAMAQFFEGADEGRSKGKLTSFFSDHPVPSNRVARINDEVEKLGGLPPDYKTDSAEFRAVRRLIASIPSVVPAKAQHQGQDEEQEQQPPASDPGGISH